jgi:predicted RNase H-like nuclease (RuvC/YqgF family)
VLCSNRVITEKIHPIGAIGEHYSDRYLLGREMNNEQNIKDYKKIQEELNSQNSTLQASVTGLQNQLDNIRNSKSFKFLRMLRRLIRHFTPN